ncbi:hypothetical protein AAG570_006177 [Ranatra chinensis]|uniref:Uncharacterized protein n=1 Tax=Ranatra chinensis TaxID=642074 RepID=A0ABD0YCB1_9HEMI
MTSNRRNTFDNDDEQETIGLVESVSLQELLEEEVYLLWPAISYFEAVDPKPFNNELRARDDGPRGVVRSSSRTISTRMGDAEDQNRPLAACRIPRGPYTCSHPPSATYRGVPGTETAGNGPKTSEGPDGTPPRTGSALLADNNLAPSLDTILSAHAPAAYEINLQDLL